MPNIKGEIAQTDVSRGSEGAFKYARMLRDGTLVGAGWKQAAIAQGLGYQVVVGAFSTPLTGGGNGTVVDIDQPEVAISVPSGTTILPIRISIQLVHPLLATDDDEAEALISVDKDVATAFDGTWATTETPLNLKTGDGAGSKCTVKSACTADTTDPTLDLELDRLLVHGDVQGTAANAMWNIAKLLYEPDASPLIEGPATLICYWGGTVATDGFAQINYLEFPSSAFD